MRVQVVDRLAAPLLWHLGHNVRAGVARNDRVDVLEASDCHPVARGSDETGRSLYLRPHRAGRELVALQFVRRHPSEKTLIRRPP